MVISKEKIDIIDARNNNYLKDLFFEQNIGLVYRVAHKLNNIMLDLEERISLGQLGLMNAFNTYNTDLPYAFSTYATKCIMNEILYENRKARYRRSQKIQSLEKPINTSVDGDQLLLMDIISNPEEDFDAEDFKLVEEVYEEFKYYYSIKNPDMIKIFDMFILEEKTTADIGKELGYSQSQGSRLAKKTIQAIQEIAIEMEVIDCFNRYAKRPKREDAKKVKEKDNNIKRKILYAILNYPKLEQFEISKIFNCSSIKVGLVKRSYENGTFKLSPDDSAKKIIENYLANKLF